MRCSACGTDIKDNSIFCVECGASAMQDTIVKVAWMSKEPFKQSLMLPVVNKSAEGKTGPMYKPWQEGGLWTSTYEPKNGYESEWHSAWDDMFGGKETSLNHYILHINVKKDRILTIDCYDHLAHYVRRYPLVSSMSIAIDRTFFDYEAIFEDYDVIHLTSSGQWATRLTNPHSLYGWDADTWFWGSVDLIEQEPLGEVKSYPREDLI